MRVKILKSSLDENATEISKFKYCFDAYLRVSLSFNNAKFAPVFAVFANNNSRHFCLVEVTALTPDNL